VSDTVRDAPEGSSMAYSLEEIRVLAKREPFRAGVRMRYLMPRVSVRVTRWILHHLPNVTPNQLTLVSAVLGVAAGAFLLVPRGIAPAVVALLLYQLHILFDYVDGEIARVKQLASPLGAYYDLMVGRLVKPVVIYSAVIGTWLGTKDPTDAPRDLLLGTLILLGFFLDKEAVDVWPTRAAPTSRIPMWSGPTAPSGVCGGAWRGFWLGCAASRPCSSTRCSRRW
jgi:CDP-alcohol phosphatidyltransferase